MRKLVGMVGFGWGAWYCIMSHKDIIMRMCVCETVCPHHAVTSMSAVLKR